MSWSTRLEKLGFTREQMVRCRTNSRAQVYIPARVNGQPVQLIFATGAPAPCHLFQSYASDRGLSVTDAYTLLEEFSAFGRTVSDVRAMVAGDYRFGDPPIAGYLSGSFLKDGIVAIDTSVPAMALTTTREQLTLTGAISRLALNGNTVVIDGKKYVISYQLDSAVAGQGERADLTLRLPEGPTVTQSVGVRTYPSKVDGTLGADLWCRWVTVFDFTTGELLLFSYD